MTALTPAEIASMVAEANEYEREYCQTTLASHVRALAAECERLRKSNTTYKAAFADLQAGEFSDETIDSVVVERDKLRAELADERKRCEVNTSALRHHIKKWTETRDMNEVLEAQLKAVTSQPK